MREYLELRTHCLQMALSNNPGGESSIIIKAAQEYYDFILGPPAAADPAAQMERKYILGSGSGIPGELRWKGK